MGLPGATHRSTKLSTAHGAQNHCPSVLLGLLGHPGQCTHLKGAAEAALIWEGQSALVSPPVGPALWVPQDAPGQHGPYPRVLGRCWGLCLCAPHVVGSGKGRHGPGPLQLRVQWSVFWPPALLTRRDVGPTIGRTDNSFSAPRSPEELSSPGTANPHGNHGVLLRPAVWLPEGTPTATGTQPGTWPQAPASSMSLGHRVPVGFRE